MLDNDTTLRDELIVALQELTDGTHDVFLKLADTFPSLLKELFRSLEASGAAVASFETGEAADDVSLKRTIADTRVLVDNASDRLEEFQSHDEQLFRRLDAEIERLTSLDTFIGRIREDSVEMELISLNAMTVALKAGSAGRAFSYITEELKRLSNRTIALTEEIADRGATLLDEFTSFRDSVREIRAFQEQFFTRFREELHACFDSCTTGISELTSSLKNIRSHSETVKAPLSAIMEHVQVHDIIKQSIDHVVISLRELRNVDTNGTDEDTLDELSFLARIPDLCSALLRDIQSKISTSRTVFAENNAQIETTLNEVEERRRKFVNSSIGADGRLHGLFRDTEESLTQLTSDLNKAARMKQRIASASREIVGRLRALEEDFTSFSSMLTRFHAIDIASRIEVAKQEVLRRMGGTVEQMTDLTRRIELDVTHALNETKAFIAETNVTILTFQEAFESQEQFAAEFAADVRTAYDSLTLARKSMASSLESFAFFSRGFTTLFTDVRAELERLDVLDGEIDRVIGRLYTVKEDSERRMKPILARLNRESWHIENEKLQRMIERFTILTHKKSAAEIGGFEVEEGAESGEVTLF